MTVSFDKRTNRIFDPTYEGRSVRGIYLIDWVVRPELDFQVKWLGTWRGCAEMDIPVA
jgi:hypothetical protein